ncbi:argininosuccinate lyase [Burkholderia pseudomallei]|uniref:argininosuccinate lyase n=1 Tax=Burkholderia pseudomallei TaxID=28450 RepID=UPI0007BF0D84|nr:argininosuccinate lyase [Burkholderia pseudomallei]MBD2941345.1 argininosuccinate lyase [Burkholderia pseudomallei]MBD2947627.1 argininosuccinate lyase [Burkholderia pseudomallei]MBD2984758.1 argininosuccinate lyase [Burkholderia pseudomallei]MBD2990379.1 argininosuccinate lyase [Burkholderia pseudomallei]MBF4016682.1 argininosuccinate lyase [Burkholderia pseudomallei]
MSNPMANPWAGRFSQTMTDSLVAFNTSLPLETRLFEADIDGTAAHVEMLHATGLLETAEHEALARALDEIRAAWRAGEIRLSPALEDIHMNLETLLVDKLGELGKKTHTARSRNDQQASAQRLYFMRSTRELVDAIDALQRAVLEHGERHDALVMPSYTHLQRAEFTYYAHWLATYVVMLERDRSRFVDALARADQCPLGACASTGTSLPIDRRRSASRLGFREPTLHSIDSVSDRDYLVEFCSHAANLMIHLSRLSEELISFTSQEFGFIALADGYCTGSSIMPQKKNPDVPELVRGKAASVIGNAMSLMALLKALPLGYNKDLQEDKTAWFAALDNCMSSLAILTELVRTMAPVPDRMRQATLGGHIIATEYANYLVRKGMPFREAHRVVGELVKTADARGVDVSALPQAAFAEASPLFGDDIGRVTVEDMVSRKNSYGSCGDQALGELLAQLRSMLDAHRPGR